MDKKSDKFPTLCICLTLALATFGAYWQVRNCDFVNYDDTDYITENQNVKAGLTRDSIAWAFTATHSGNWHPLTWLSHMLDCQLFKTKPAWHHLTNLLLHIANTLLLFAVFKRMTHKLWRSAFVAAVFALHPLHVESVAWISERKDVLSTLFWMLTMAAYLRYTERPAIGRYLLTLLLFALGLMAKPMLVTLPFVLLLLDYWPLGRFQSAQAVKGVKQRRPRAANVSSRWKLSCRLVWEKVPFLLLSAISSIITFLVQRSSGAVKAASFTIRTANAFLSYTKYIAKMIWPRHLAAFYPHLRGDLPIGRAALAALLIAAITVYIMCQAGRRRWLAVGWLWYLGTLVPVIGLVQVGTQAIADRYTYVPTIGLFIIIAWALPELIEPWPYKKIALAIGTAAVVSAMMICTWRQVGYWRNSYTLFSHAVAVTKDNYVAHHGLGTALFEQARYRDAIFHYEQTLKIKPNHANAPGDIGLALLQLGKYDQAAVRFRQALARNGELHKWHLALAATLLKLRQPDEAVVHFTEALRLRPDWVEPMNNLAWFLATRKDAKYYNPHKAVQLARRACELTGYENPLLLDTLAVAYAAANRFSDAVATAEKALKLARSSGQSRLTDEIQNRLRLYRVGQPYVERSAKKYPAK